MSSDGDKAVLETKIKNIDQQIVVLQELKVQCLQKLYSLAQTAVPVSFQPSITINSDDKATIFRGYFHGVGMMSMPSCG